MSKNADHQFDVEGGGSYDSKKGNLSVAVLTVRIATMVSLIVSVAVLHTNDITIKDDDDVYTYSYRSVFSYKYAFGAALFGLATNLFSTIHYVLRKKLHKINSFGILRFCFYLDKVAALLLATGSGAALCATVDLKRVRWNVDDEDMQDFFSIGYIAAGILLVGCLAAVASSVHSSLTLTKI